MNLKDDERHFLAFGTYDRSLLWEEFRLLLPFPCLPLFLLFVRSHDFRRGAPLDNKGSLVESFNPEDDRFRACFDRCGLISALPARYADVASSFRIRRTAFASASAMAARLDYFEHVTRACVCVKSSVSRIIIF